jgi:hypothetical protein
MSAPHRPPSLRLIQALAVAVEWRCVAATRQALQVLALLEPEDGEGMLRCLVDRLEPDSRYWLATIDGRRARA